MKQNRQLLAQWLRILCAVAVMSVGFAHKPVMAYAPSDIYSSAYQLPDGTFADICTSHDGDMQKGKMIDHGCDACRLSATTLLPNPPLVAGSIIRISTEMAIIERPETVRHRLYPPNSGPRAPPFLLMFI